MNQRKSLGTKMQVWPKCNGGGVKKINLYIDNSAFVNIKFDFNHPSLRTIYDGVKKKKISTYLNPILVHEMKKHLKKQISEEVYLCHQPFPVLRSHGAVVIDMEFVKQKKTKITELTFKKIIDGLKPKVLNFKKVNADVIANLYLKKEPPFSESKKDEFPDAFAVETLRPLFKKNLYVVSSDSDFAKYFSNHAEVKLFKDLKEFANHFLKLNEEYKNFKRIISFVKKAASEEMKSIRENIVDCEVFAEDGESSIEDIKVQELKITSYEVTGVDHESGIISASLQYDGIIDFSISTPVIAWDSIDKEEIYIGCNKNRGESIFTVTEELEIITTDNQYNFYEVVSVVDYIPEIEVKPDWGSFLNYEEENDEDIK